MAASSKRNLESKGEIVRIKGGIDNPLFNSAAILNIISEYSGFYAPSAAWIRFFKPPSLQEEILNCAHYAAPFEIIETLVQKAHDREEEHLPDTLIQAALQAIYNRDVSLRDDNNVIIYEGMAEKLLQLCSKLFPESFSKKLFPRFQEQARLAAPLENKEQKKDKERRFKAEVKKIFDAIKNNNDKTLAELQVFKDWAKNLSVADKILAIFLARIELANRGGDLPSIDSEDRGRWNGLLGDRFCNEVLWEALQKNLPPRQQQIFACGIYQVFNPALGTELIRFIDLGSFSFIANRRFFYNEFAHSSRMANGALFGILLHYFSKLITSNDISVQTLCHCSEQFIAQRATAPIQRSQ